MVYLSSRTCEPCCWRPSPSPRSWPERRRRIAPSSSGTSPTASRSLSFRRRTPCPGQRSNWDRHLFYDKRLSVNGTQSCGSCHQQEFAFTGGRARAVGATGEEHPRSSMSLVNVAHAPALTWAHPALRSSIRSSWTLPVTLPPFFHTSVSSTEEPLPPQDSSVSSTATKASSSRSDASSWCTSPRSILAFSEAIIVQSLGAEPLGAGLETSARRRRSTSVSVGCSKLASTANSPRRHWTDSATSLCSMATQKREEKYRRWAAEVTLTEQRGPVSPSFEMHWLKHYYDPFTSAART